MVNFTIMDWIKLLGFLFVVVATIISTAWIPVLDNQIEREAVYVTKFTDRRMLSLGIMLHNGQLDTQRMINFLEMKLVGSGIGEKDRIEVLSKRVLSETQMMLKTWAGLFAESKEWASHVDEQTHEIIQDNNLSEQEKFNQLDNMRDEKRDAAFKRVEESETKRKEHRSKMRKLKNNKNAWYAIFCLLQIVGLILISGGEIVQKLIQRKTTER